MKLLHRKGRWPKLHFRSIGARLGFILALLAVGMAFWFNSQRQLQNVALRGSSSMQVYDAGSLLSPDQREVLSQYQTQFFASYGIRLHLALLGPGETEYLLPNFGSTPFVAVVIAVEEKFLGFTMSPLVEAAITPGWLDETSTMRLVPLMEKGLWPEALNETLNALSGRLQAVMEK